MAEVFLGTTYSIGGFERRFAIKMVHRHLLNNEQFVSMLLDEARIAGLVNHANVVGVLDVHYSGDQLFLVMDYVEGMTLADLATALWDGEGMVPIEITLRVGFDMLSALEAVHDLRGPDGSLLHVVHRDLSPRNVLIGTDGICRLTDFGIVLARGRLTETPPNVVKGTLGYVAPEVIVGRTVDQRADLYSLGVLLWELLTGRRLFRRTRPLRGNGDRRLTFPATHVPSPQECNPSVPSSVAQVCFKALQPDPADRYETATDMRAALEQASSAAGLGEAESHLTGRLVSALRRNRRRTFQVDRDPASKSPD